MMSADNKVLSILEDIKKSNSSDHQNSSENTITESSNQNDNKLDKTDEIRGRPKSGRFWKTKKEKFSSIVNTKGIKTDFQKKAALRIELKRSKDLSRQLLEQIKEKELAKKERRRENIRKAEENKKKSEIVQVITNTAKLKRMKKKHLRFIEKRDTNNAINSNKL